MGREIVGAIGIEFSPELHYILFIFFIADHFFHRLFHLRGFGPFSFQVNTQFKVADPCIE